MTQTPGEDRSVTFTWADPAGPLALLPEMAGLAYLEAVRDGQVPGPPIAAVMQLELREVEPGRVEFLGQPTEAHFNPLGTIHGGYACTALDTAVGCAVHTLLDAGTGYTSIDLNVSYLRPILPSSAPLRIVGRVTKPGTRVTFAEAQITDSAGVLVATATSALLILRPPAS